MAAKIKNTAISNKMLRAGMPQAAVDKLRQMYCKDDMSDIKDLKLKSDPNVDGTYAVRITRYENAKKSETFTFDLLWNHGDYDEVEFSSWPPSSNRNNLQFFI